MFETRESVYIAIFYTCRKRKYRVHFVSYKKGLVILHHTCFFNISSQKLEQIPHITVNKLDRFYKVKLFMTFYTNQFSTSYFQQYVDFHKSSLDTVRTLFFSDFETNITVTCTFYMYLGRTR